MRGAIMRAYHDLWSLGINGREFTEIQKLFPHHLVGFNDTNGRTQEEVVAAFDAVLASLTPTEPERLFQEAPEQEPVPV